MNRMPTSGGHAVARPERRRASLRTRPGLLPLESRQLLSASAVEPSADEQYIVQLVNRARANPQAEAQRLLAIARADPTILPALQGWDASAFLREMNARGPLPPLALNPRLTAAARAHDTAMVAANAQFHSASGSLARPTDPSQLAPDGQPYYPTGDSSWATAENVFAYSANLPDSHGKALDDFFHEAFLLDWGNPDFGHLRNILSPGPSGASASGTYAMSEIGVGLLTDARPAIAPTSDPHIAANLGLNVGPALITQEFGWRSGHQFLTGATFADRDGDGFYTGGEGLGGVTIRAVNRDTGATFSAVTWGSGGYSLDLPSGSYDVTASGGGLAAPRTTTVHLGVDNVGWDVNEASPVVKAVVNPTVTPTTPAAITTPAAVRRPTVAVPSVPATPQKRRAQRDARVQHPKPTKASRQAVIGASAQAAAQANLSWLKTLPQKARARAIAALKAVQARAGR